jgi:hypothetical protein
MGAETETAALLYCLGLGLVCAGFLGILNTVIDWWSRQYPDDPYDF